MRSTESHSSCYCLIETSRNDILCVYSLTVFEVLLLASKSHHKHKYLLAKASLFPPNIRIFGSLPPRTIEKTSTRHHNKHRCS